VVAAVRPTLNAREFGPLPASAALADGSLPPCLIVNPRSFRASRGLAAQATAMARAHGTQVVQVDGPDALTAAVESILARRQRRVMVLAGDGTVRAVVDQLARLPPGTWTPDLLVLPGGRSNLTAADLVPGRPALATLKLALLRVAQERWDEAVVERFTLRVEQAPAPARYGFCIGAALIDSVIRRIHEHRAGSGGELRTGHLSTPWWLLGLGVSALRGRSDLSCPHLQVDAEGCGRLDEPVSLLLGTTLLHRTGAFDPYASRGEDDLRVTAVARRAPRLWRSLPRLLTGRYSESMNLDNGYLSGSCERLQITGLGGYSLDGEKFDTDPARPVAVTRGPRLRFLSL
jgi:hypothetical protein